MKSTQFYACGLEFTCKRCSSCCRYESGFVFLSEEDLNKITDALKTNKKTFLAVYCRWVTDMEGNELLSLKEKSNKDCILWDNGCTVYGVRPVQCVTFPFWESILASEETWEIAASGCPGINSGITHSKEAIMQKIKLRSKYPIINKTGVEV